MAYRSGPPPSPRRTPNSKPRRSFSHRAGVSGTSIRHYRPTHSESVRCARSVLRRCHSAAPRAIWRAALSKSSDVERARSSLLVLDETLKHGAMLCSPSNYDELPTVGLSVDTVDDRQRGLQCVSQCLVALAQRRVRSSQLRDFVDAHLPCHSSRRPDRGERDRAHDDCPFIPPALPLPASRWPRHRLPFGSDNLHRASTNHDAAARTRVPELRRSAVGGDSEPAPYVVPWRSVAPWSRRSRLLVARVLGRELRAVQLGRTGAACGALLLAR